MIEKRYCLTPEEWAYAKAELVLAEKLGLIENADIEALEKRCAEKNEENAGLKWRKRYFTDRADIHCRCIYSMN